MIPRAIVPTCLLRADTNHKAKAHFLIGLHRLFFIDSWTGLLQFSGT